MRLSLITFCFFSLLHNQLKAQSWAFGPEIGLNFINIESDYVGNSYSGGWHVGGFAEYAFSENFSIRSGLHFTQKKQSYSDADTSLLSILSLIGIEDIDQFDLNTYSQTEGRAIQNYIELPLLAKASFNGLSVSAGIYGALMINSVSREVETENTPILSVINTQELGFFGAFIPAASSTSESIIENSNRLRAFDFGTRFGASYRFDKVELNFGYSLGLLDYRKSNAGLEIQRHQYFQLSLSYNFGVDPGSGSFWQSKKMQ